jgi:hypothetical protein
MPQQSLAEPSLGREVLALGQATMLVGPPVKVAKQHQFR